MLQQRIGAKHAIHANPKGTAITGIVYALPVAAALWVAIAAIAFLIF